MAERIRIENLSKKFKLGYEKRQSFLNRMLYLLSGKEPKRTIWALKKISLKADDNEIIGLIGPNGSGKSTLLRLLIKTYQPDDGLISTNGRAIFLSGPEVGLRLRLTMKENIYLSCYLFGLNTKEIKKILPQIIEFSEIKDYLYTKINQFSSGMIARLAFSIGINLIKEKNPEIILLDEIFAVGDQGFIEKSYEELKKVTKNSTIIIASHDLPSMLKWCTRIIWIDKGEITMDGEPKEVIKGYIQSFKKN